MTYLAESYLIVPGGTQQSATAEGYTSNTNSYCPEFNPALFGTNGNQSSPGFTASTVLEIWHNNTDIWSDWTPANDVTTNVTGGAYSLTTLSNYDAFKVSGGG